MAVAEMLEALSTDFIARHPREAARCLEELDLADAVGLLEAEPPGTAARLIARTDPDRAVEVLGALRPETIADITPLLELQLLAGLLARMDGAARERQLEALGAPVAKELTELMSYPPQTAGALMDPRADAFRASQTADQALAKLRGMGREVGIDIQVVDEDRKLLGHLSVQGLIGAQPQAKLGELAEPPLAVPVTAGLDEILETIKGSRAGVSVVDVDGRLLGVIRRNRLTSAAEQEATAGLQTMVGVSKEERALSNPGFSVRRRLPWLFVNLGTAFLAATVVGVFESTIAQVTALAVLLPVVAGQSGNSGSQALAVTLRGLALREIRTSQWKRVGIKEVMVGFVNGIAIAVATAVGVIIWSGSPLLGVVIALAMVISMVLAGLAGATIPMALKALGQDPAQSSAIFLTTVTDVVGFASFLGLATIFASML